VLLIELLPEVRSGPKFGVEVQKTSTLRPEAPTPSMGGGIDHTPVAAIASRVNLGRAVYLSLKLLEVGDERLAFRKRRPSVEVHAVCRRD
jgi:hypothetical protein